jgi:Cytochrome c oxidase subunit IIa family
MSTSAVEHTDDPDALDEEHFKPTGTVFVLVLFVATIILLWASVYVILLSRGVTV